MNPDDFDHAQTLEDLALRVRSFLKVQGVLVTQITSDSQVILANAGVALPDRFAISMPLKYSICQHTAAMNFPLAIDDTITHPLLKDSLAFKELRVGAYLGAPLHGADGHATGAICALEYTQRRWEAEEIASVTHAARVADRLIRRPN